MQSALPKDTALIEYLRYEQYLGKRKLESHYGAIVLTSKGKPRWVPLGKADEIEPAVERYRNQVNPDRDTAEQTLEETLRTLFQQVWVPLQKVLPENTHTVIISPDAQLNFVSFATLLTSKDRFLAEDHNIQYVSSGRDLLRDIKLATNSQLIAFGNPDYDLKAVPLEKGEPVGQQIALRGKTREALVTTRTNSGLMGLRKRSHVSSAVVSNPLSHPACSSTSVSKVMMTKTGNARSKCRQNDRWGLGSLTWRRLPGFLQGKSIEVGAQERTRCVRRCFFPPLFSQSDAFLKSRSSAFVSSAV